MTDGRDTNDETLIASPRLSVIICTHNPRQDYLRQTLEHLRTQNLSTTAWELLIVDNRSDPLVSSWCDLSWHPQGRIVREESLGLTNARLCGIANTTGDLLVFVDDDNLLCADYLQESLMLAAEWPTLGAWGGCILPRYESPPEPQLERYYPYLAIRPLTDDRWGNLYNMEITPFGAGLVVRRNVANQYRDLALTTCNRRRLDRTGASLISCGDVDLAWTSVDIGLGMGVFKRLELTHLIPAFRMQVDYLLKMVESNRASHILLDAMRGRPLPSQRKGWLRRVLDELRIIRLNRVDRRFARAATRGQGLGFEMAACFRNTEESADTPSKHHAH